MSDAPEQAMKRANATDSAECALATMHARDFQVRLAKRHPARWRLVKGLSRPDEDMDEDEFKGPMGPVAVTRRNRLVTIEALVKGRLLRPCDENDDTEDVRLWRWQLTGWGLMVREAEHDAGVYTRTEATS